MKYLKEGEEMPVDFWNYAVNPILGYNVQKFREHTLKDELKYRG